MTSETPRYRCAAERGFLPEGSHIIFYAKHDGREGVGSRVEQDDEFYFDGAPGAWMAPVNEAARERIQSLVDKGKRKGIAAEVAAQNTPVTPPRSGLQASRLSPDNGASMQIGPRENAPDRPAPRRRTAAKAV